VKYYNLPMPHPLMKWIGNGINVQDDPSPSHRQAAAVNLVSLSDGVTQGRQGNGVEGLDNNNYIIYKINMYIYIHNTYYIDTTICICKTHTYSYIHIYIHMYVCVCVPVLQKYAIEHKNHSPYMQMFFLGICCFSFCQLQMLHVASWAWLNDPQ